MHIFEFKGVIKTIPMDYFINLLTGSVIALAAWDEIRQAESIFATRSFKQAFLFGLLVFLPIGYFLAFTFTGWSWMYFIDPSRYSLLVTFLCVTGYLPALLVGYILTAWLIRMDGGALAFGPAAVGFLGFLFFLTVPYKRLLYLGSYQQFVTQTAPSIFTNVFFLASMGIIGIYYFVPLIYILYTNMKTGVAFRTKS